jgi:hypothetical protein
VFDTVPEVECAFPAVLVEPPFAIVDCAPLLVQQASPAMTGAFEHLAVVNGTIRQ